MKEDPFERSLRAFCQRQPFKPFLVELASGAQLTIDHPEALLTADEPPCTSIGRATSLYSITKALRSWPTSPVTVRTAAKQL